MIAIVSCRTSDFSGKSLNICDETKIFVNPKEDARHEQLFQWYLLLKSYSDFHPLSGSLNVETLGVANQPTSTPVNLSDLSDAVAQREDFIKAQQ